MMTTLQRRISRKKFFQVGFFMALGLAVLSLCLSPRFGIAGGSSLIDLARTDDSYIRRSLDYERISPCKGRRAKTTPEIVWLMSFPNSGTTYTVANTEHMSNASTATNYGTEMTNEEKQVPVFEYLPGGPFRYSPNLKLPPKILTKTHCTLYCDDCPPNRSLLQVDIFEKGCRTGLKQVGDNNVNRTLYGSDLPTTAVHLFRSPFDNIVARMHRGVIRRRKLGWTEKQLSIFNDTKAGFHTWCNYIDTKFSGFETEYGLSNDIVELINDIPCFSDYFRYVQWHNLAIEVTKLLKLPVHILYYEDYATSYERTVRDLSHFLDLQIVQPPLPFVPGKTYEYLHETKEFVAVAKFIRALASAEAWVFLRPYVIGWVRDGDANATTILETPITI